MRVRRATTEVTALSILSFETNYQLIDLLVVFVTQFLHILHIL